MSSPDSSAVTRLRDLQFEAASAFLNARGLCLQLLPEGTDIPGSYWGAPEAGLIGNKLFARLDTPVHSILHTVCHWICMDGERRMNVHTDAGGDDIEEVAVCYLQCLMSDDLPGYSRESAFLDMDSWGYSFRLGSARAWFENDAEDALEWLKARGLRLADSCRSAER